MAFEAFFSGAWRAPRRGGILIGGTWRAITRGEVFRGGTWRPVVAFVAPLSVSANNASGIVSDRRPAQVTSDVSQARPAGGLAPYSYSWSIVSGSASINSPSTAATTFSAIVGPGIYLESTARVACTDALGRTATADITITLENIGV